jgi:hypothetical protein
LASGQTVFPPHFALPNNTSHYKMMLLFFGLGTANRCVWDENLTGSITFRNYRANAGETICYRYLPPRTAVVFQDLPPSKLLAWSWVSGAPHTLNATNHTRGFYTGDHPGSLELTLSETGNVSLFAVTFPDDCDTMIVSTKKRDLIRERASSQKVCYFNGAAVSHDLAIELSAGISGELTSKTLGLALRGDSRADLQDVNASVITWSGEIEDVQVGVRAGAPDGRGFSQKLNASAASLIEFSEAESWVRTLRSRFGGHRWRFWEADRDDRGFQGMGFRGRFWRGGHRGPRSFGRGGRAPYRGTERHEGPRNRGRRPRMEHNEPDAQ